MWKAGQRHSRLALSSEGTDLHPEDHLVLLIEIKESKKKSKGWLWRSDCFCRCPQGHKGHVLLKHGHPEGHGHHLITLPEKALSLSCHTDAFLAHGQLCVHQYLSLSQQFSSHLAPSPPLCAVPQTFLFVLLEGRNDICFFQSSGHCLHKSQVQIVRVLRCAALTSYLCSALITDCIHF